MTVAKQKVSANRNREKTYWKKTFKLSGVHCWAPCLAFGRWKPGRKKQTNFGLKHKQNTQIKIAYISSVRRSPVERFLRQGVKHRSARMLPVISRLSNYQYALELSRTPPRTNGSICIFDYAYVCAPLQWSVRAARVTSHGQSLIKISLRCVRTQNTTNARSGAFSLFQCTTGKGNIICSVL